MLANILGGFIVIVIATSLTPIVANTVYASTHNASNGVARVNVTGASATLINLVTLFWVMSIMATGVAITVTALKEADIM